MQMTVASFTDLDAFFASLLGGGGGGAPFIVPSAPKLSSKINNRLDPLNSLFSKNSMKQIFFNVKY